MFVWLRSLVCTNAVVELHSRRIRVHALSTASTFEFEPLLSVDGSPCVVSIGRPIAASAVKTYAPFANQSALEQDRRMAELLLQYAYSKLGSVAWLKPAPKIVLLVPGDPANEIRLIDDEALIQVSAMAGARITVVHRGSSVSPEEAQRLLDAA
jgi:hypothetical protein